jgi:tetratricopeptide (TPR) repeat protein
MTLAVQKEVEVLFRRALAIDPGREIKVRVLFRFADILDENPATCTEAVELYRRLLAVDPEHKSALVNLSILLKRDPATWNEARTCLRRVLEMDPDCANTLHNLANVICMSKEPGERAEAPALYRRALAVNPSFVPSLMGLAQVLVRDPATHGESRALYNRALALDPSVQVDRYLPWGYPLGRWFSVGGAPLGERVDVPATQAVTFDMSALLAAATAAVDPAVQFADATEDEALRIDDGAIGALGACSGDDVDADLAAALALSMQIPVTADAAAAGVPWACDTCTFINEEGGILACAACGTTR